jgi:hypothetical protein
MVSLALESQEKKQYFDKIPAFSLNPVIQNLKKS